MVCRLCGAGEFAFDGDHMVKFCKTCGAVEEEDMWHLLI